MIVNYIHRQIEPHIIKELKPNRAVILVGARRVGKTELIKFISHKLDINFKLLYGGDIDTLSLLERRTTANYRQLLGGDELLIIDEAQEIPDIGAKIKLMLDTIDGIKVMATGSSAFDLTNQIGEPLVGRKVTFELFPFAQTELNRYEDLLQTRANLSMRLVLGSYPELESIVSVEEKVNYLKEIVNAYLLKDVLAFEGVKNRTLILSLLRKIAFRVGSELSIEGLGNELGISKNTVDKYLDLFTKVYIIHRVTGFSRNLDNEVTKKSKWYFYDNGIRNALIGNFSDLHLRDDVGALWENYLISERMKLLSYSRSHSSHYFWRTHRMQEIDWVEEKDGQLSAFEFKWGTSKKPSPPKTWLKAYPDSNYQVITPNNYLDFIT